MLIILQACTAGYVCDQPGLVSATKLCPGGDPCFFWQLQIELNKIDIIAHLEHLLQYICLTELVLLFLAQQDHIVLLV